MNYDHVLHFITQQRIDFVDADADEELDRTENEAIDALIQKVWSITSYCCLLNSRPGLLVRKVRHCSLHD